MSSSRPFLRRGFRILHSRIISYARLPLTGGSHGGISGGLSNVGVGRGQLRSMCSSDDSDYLPPGHSDPLGDFFDAFMKTCACLFGLNVILLKLQTSSQVESCYQTSGTRGRNYKCKFVLLCYKIIIITFFFFKFLFQVSLNRFFFSIGQTAQSNKFSTAMVDFFSSK